MATLTREEATWRRAEQSPPVSQSEMFLDRLERDARKKLEVGVFLTP